jgi:hypothetical protein
MEALVAAPRGFGGGSGGFGGFGGFGRWLLCCSLFGGWLFCSQFVQVDRLNKYFLLMQSTLKKRRVLPPPRTAVIMFVSQLHGLASSVHLQPLVLWVKCVLSACAVL